MNSMYDILDKMKLLEGRGSKPDFLDLDRDGDRKEPMKKAAKEKKVDEAVEEMAGQVQHPFPVIQTPGGTFVDNRSIAQELTKKAAQLKSKPQGMMGKMLRPGVEAAQDKTVGVSQWLAKAFNQSETEGAQLVNMIMTSPNPEYSQYRDAFDSLVMDLKQSGIDLQAAAKAALNPGKYLQNAAKPAVAEADMEEGNDFTGARLAAIRAGKPTFSVGGKTYKVTGDTSDEKVMEREYGNRDDFDRYAKKGDTIRTEKGTLTKTDHGVKHERRADDNDDEDKDRDSDAPKKRGRPKGSKHATGAKVKTTSKLHRKPPIKEENFVDQEEISLIDKGEYDREGDMAKEQLHTVMDAAKELHSILDADDNLPEWVQSKITKALDYLDTARDYVKASDAEDREVAEVAPPGAKAERMVKHIKKGYAKDGQLTPKEKSIAYATAWKAHKAGRVEEESTETRDERAEKAGRRVAKDIEYDEKVKDKIHGKKRGSEDSKAERAGKKVTKDIEYDEKVDETTVSGSVAVATDAPKGKKNGMVFGKGVYESKLEESYKTRLDQLLIEGMSISANQSEDGKKSLSVNATDEDAIKLAQILQLAGMQQGQDYHDVCPACGQSPCGCEELEEGEYANSPEAEYSDTDTMVNTLSGGLNGRKTTGQTVVPVINRDPRRQVSVDQYTETVKEEAEQRLWNLYKRYENK